jgi:hypothetical protein
MIFLTVVMVYPEVRKKASGEIDRVIGRNRLLNGADHDKIVYIMSIMKGTHRWHLVQPMCLPHCGTEDDTCRGYRILKGAIQMPNN